VGGFVLGGLGLVVAAILFFGGGALFSRSDRAVAFFQGSVGGLTVGVPVTFRGLQIGAVTSVSLVLDVRDMQARIPVYLALKPELVRLADGPAGVAQLPTLRQLIGAGLRGKLVSQSFVTGQMAVELDLDPAAPVHLVGGGEQGVPEIPTMPSDLAELRQQIMRAPIAETVAQADRTLAAIERITNKIDAHLDPIIADATLGLGSARQMMEAVQASIARMQQDASKMLNEGTALARDGREQLSARGPELARALRAADQALRTANTLFASANGVIAPGSRDRDDIDATLRDLASAISSFRSVSHTIDRNPSVLLTGRSGP
jgi:paraquat-inducible protein B